MPAAPPIESSPRASSASGSSRYYMLERTSPVFYAAGGLPQRRLAVRHAVELRKRYGRSAPVHSLCRMDCAACGSLDIVRAVLRSAS